MISNWKQAINSMWTFCRKSTQLRIHWICATRNVFTNHTGNSIQPIDDYCDILLKMASKVNVGYIEMKFVLKSLMWNDFFEYLMILSAKYPTYK